MSTSVLFDAPGPRARVRHRMYSGGVLLLVAAVLAFVAYRFNENGLFQRRYFEALTSENVIRALRDGLLATLKAAAIAIGTSIVLGLVLALARLSDHRWLRWPAGLVVEFFRAVPLLLMIFVAFIFLQVQVGLDTDAAALTGLVVGLTLYNGSVLAEVFRAGIHAVPKGQSEASYALGMRKHQVMRLVLVPQGVRTMLPAIVSQCVVVLKDSSLGFFISYPELLRQGKQVAIFAGSQVWTMLLIAAIYITINSVLALIAEMLRRRGQQKAPKSKTRKGVVAPTPDASASGVSLG